MEKLSRMSKTGAAGTEQDASTSMQDRPRFEVRVSQDGGTVWVNGADGASIGRFSKQFGMDVHRTSAEQLEGMGQCLACTHERAGAAEWDAFRSKMLEHHGVALKRNLVSF
jgi:hypothetical protein